MNPLHRGKTSEKFFEYEYYKVVENLEYQLLPPQVDIGWDFLIAKTGKRIQVKRFTPQEKRYNPNTLDLRRKRNKGTGNYTGKEFDYLVVHNTSNDDLIIANIDQLKKEDGKMKTSISICPTRKGNGLINEGFEVLVK
tara:strand:+ start:401 stop:814 length:414 start_codon:yes stop_codon:yes gene_type:complete